MSDFRAGDLSERERRLSHRSNDGRTGVAAAPQHPVLRMQRTVGNAAVARMLQRSGEEEELQAKHDTSIQRSEGGEAEEEELQAKHDTSIQRSEGGEAEEEEMQAKHDTSIQRSEGAEAEEEEVQMKRDTSIQRKAVGLEGGALDEDMSNLIDSKRGAGSTLDDGVRNQAEAAMGTSFDGVRVHRDSDADMINRNITAKAFTTGNDIFLRGDQNPGDASLMTHELTHVVQQRSMGGGGAQGKTVGAANDPYEQEADRVAQAVTSGEAQREIDDGAH